MFVNAHNPMEPTWDSELCWSVCPIPRAHATQPNQTTAPKPPTQRTHSRQSHRARLSVCLRSHPSMLVSTPPVAAGGWVANPREIALSLPSAAAAAAVSASRRTKSRLARAFVRRCSGLGSKRAARPKPNSAPIGCEDRIRGIRHAASLLPEARPAAEGPPDRKSGSVRREAKGRPGGVAGDRLSGGGSAGRGAPSRAARAASADFADATASYGGSGAAEAEPDLPAEEMARLRELRLRMRQLTQQFSTAAVAEAPDTEAEG